MDHAVIIYSFLGFLACFMLVGLCSMRVRRKSADDYLLAGRSITPFCAGVSGAATTASGFAFTGMIGFGFVVGFAGIWFIFGIIFGSLIMFWITARRFRIFSQRKKSMSYTEFLTYGLNKKMGRAIPCLLGLVSLVAVTLYATAQLTAGSKALHVLFDWHYNTGAILGAVIVLAYCWAGGIRASIWTDVAQMSVMFVAMVALMVVGLQAVGGFGGLYAGLAAIDPALVNIWPTQNPFGPVMFIAGCLSVGISFIGFPHVMVRFMALKQPRDTARAIGWFEASYGLFYVVTFIVALSTRVLMNDAGSFDPELALPYLAIDLLPAVMVGVILAGIFAGTISTADSLILSGTATLTREIAPKFRNSYGAMKLCTLCVTAVALLVAITGSQNVFGLVMFVVAIMGASFAPMLVIRALRWPISEGLALAVIVGGLAAAVWWRMAGFHVHIFDSLPGMVAAFTIYGGGRLWSAWWPYLAGYGKKLDV